MKQRDETSPPPADDSMRRREFLAMSKNFTIGGLFAHLVLWDESGAAVLAIPAATGYLLVDSKKCQGCLSCMLACSLVNDGVASLTRARIQVLQNSFEKWPDDVTIEQCRQCVTPACVEACPTGALTADPKQGNVRRVDVKKCIGCTLCMAKCPFRPQRLTVTPDPTKLTGIHAAKCELCADAPFHWDAQGGGPNGKQACVEVCPVGAIQFTRQIPKQTDSGYKVNLREKSWGELGYPID